MALSRLVSNAALSDSRAAAGELAALRMASASAVAGVNDEIDALTGGIGTAATLDFDADGTLAGNSDTHVATQKATRTFVVAQIAALIASAPGALDTLKELADAINDDANFAATVTTALAAKQPLDADLTAIAALATTAFGRGFLTLADVAGLITLLVSTSGGGTATFLRADGAWALPTASVALSTVEVDLGSGPVKSGKFTIAGVGMTIGKPVLIRQAVGPYTNKGTLADEAEMDLLSVVASVTSATVITAYWTSSCLVRGNFKFDYLVGA